MEVIFCELPYSLSSKRKGTLPISTAVYPYLADIAAKLDIKADTLSKAIRAGRLHKPAKKKILITS